MSNLQRISLHYCIIFRLLISNIKLAIGNLNGYVDTKKVFLLGDTKEKKGEEESVPEQLHNVFSHIEDLVEVTDIWILWLALRVK